MPSQSSFDAYSNAAAMAQMGVGEAWASVDAVSKRLDEIRYVAYYLPQIVDLSEGVTEAQAAVVAAAASATAASNAATASANAAAASAATAQSAAAGVTTFTQTGTGAIARPYLEKAKDTVTLEDFGAVGDGTDESAKIQAAINAHAHVTGQRGRIYLAKDLSISGSKTLDMRGGILLAASGAKWLTRLTGWRPQLFNVELEDNVDAPNLARRTTLSAGAAAGATSIALTSTAGLEPGMAVAIEQTDGEWHQSLILVVNPTTVTLQTGLRGAAASGLRFWAGHGAIWLGDGANRPMVRDVLFKGTWMGVTAKPSALGITGPTKGSVESLRGYGLRMFGLHLAGNSADIDWADVLLYGTETVTGAHTGNGSTTAFNVPDDIVRIGASPDLLVWVGGVLQTPGVEYTITGPRTFTFAAPPAPGAAITYSLLTRGVSGLWSDITGGNIINGGHTFDARFLGWQYGIRLKDSELLAFKSTSFVDSISKDGIRLEGIARNNQFEGVQSLFAGRSCINVADATVVSTNAFSGLRTTRWPAASKRDGVEASVLSMASGSSVTIDASSWRGDKVYTAPEGALPVFPGASQWHFNSGGLLSAGVQFLQANGKTVTENDAIIRAPFKGTLIGMQVYAGAQPASGDTYVVTVRKGAVDTAATVTVVNGEVTGFWNGNVDLVRGDAISVSVNATGASVTRMTVVLLFAAD